MIRSVCLISREYPPETAFGGIASVVEMQARALVDAGAIVHVISLSTDGQNRRVVQDGVVVHRAAPPRVGMPTDMPYVEQGAWSATVAQHFARLDEFVRFDVVEAQDYYGEALHLARRPGLPLTIRLHALSRVVSERSGRARTPGERVFDSLELEALRDADLLLAPTQLVLDETRRVTAFELPPAELLPLPIDPARGGDGGDRTRRGDGPLRLLFVGRMEPLKGPEHALRAAAAAKARGLDVHLTLVGRDIDHYRARVLVPLVSELGLGWDEVRFVAQLDAEGVRRHLRHADVALLPSAFENFHTAAVEAIGAGVPVISGGATGLSNWLGREEGLCALPLDEAFADRAAEAIADESWLSSACERGPVAVRTLFDPAKVTRRQLELWESLTPNDDVGVPDATGPALAIVVLAHNARAFTQRCLQSVLAHTDTPFRVYLVDNASTDGTAAWAGQLDARIEVIRSDENLGVSGGRNAGIEAIDNDPDYIVFLDNDVEVGQEWWRPFVAALEDDPAAGIAGELGVEVRVHATGRETRTLTEPGPMPVDMVTGFCMVMRAEAVREIGHFDEQLGLFWHDDDDYGLRAGKLGWRVLHVGSGRIAHYEHRSSALVDGIWRSPDTPSTLSGQNQLYLTAKWQHTGLDGTRTATVVAFAAELLEDPSLYEAYAQAFDADDDATLVIYAPGGSPETVAAQLQALFDLDGGPDVLLLAVPADPDTELTVALAADALLSNRPVPSPFCAAGFGAEELDTLRRLVDRRCTPLATEGVKFAVGVAG